MHTNHRIRTLKIKINLPIYVTTVNTIQLILRFNIHQQSNRRFPLGVQYDEIFIILDVVWSKYKNAQSIEGKGPSPPPLGNPNPAQEHRKTPHLH